MYQPTFYALLVMTVLGLSACGRGLDKSAALSTPSSGTAWVGVKQTYNLSGTGLDSSTLTVSLNGSTCDKFSSSATSTSLKVRCTNPTSAGSYTMSLVDGSSTKTSTVNVLDTPTGKGGYIVINSNSEPSTGDNSAYNGIDDVCVLQTRDNNGSYLTTYLIWEVKTNSGSRSNATLGSYSTASGYATTYQSSSICGLSSWRLPTLAELTNLYDSSRVPPRINTNYFPDTNSSNYCYWATDTATSGNSMKCFNDNTSAFTTSGDLLSYRLVRAQ